VNEYLGLQQSACNDVWESDRICSRYVGVQGELLGEYTGLVGYYAPPEFGR
jgi:hypothetical protein